ncbi:MAG: hypothetical protein AAF909_14125, partial [Pseudomonadota bacterium]
HDLSSPRRRRATAYAYGARDLPPPRIATRPAAANGAPRPAAPRPSATAAISAGQSSEASPSTAEPTTPSQDDLEHTQLSQRRRDLADRIRRFSETPAARRQLRR